MMLVFCITPGVKGTAAADKVRNFPIFRLVFENLPRVVAPGFLDLRLSLERKKRILSNEGFRAVHNLKADMPVMFRSNGATIFHDAV